MRAPAIMKFLSTSSSRLERWLGTDNIERVSRDMARWYGPPIHLLDVPGSVRVGKDGDFIGPFDRGLFGSAMDHLWDRIRLAGRSPLTTLGVGFASVSDVLLRGSSGYSRSFGGGINKIGPTGVIAASSTLWRVGAQPIAGATGTAAPGGRACVSTTTGAMAFDNPASGTMHLVGADMCASVLGHSLLLYDRIFDVLKTMASSTSESVTGVPTRYLSNTVTDADYAGGNFLFIETGGTALANTAHNWTVCTYRDDAGNDAQTLPSIAGIAQCIVDRLDMPLNYWFCPLASGDVGIEDLTTIQCSASVATGVITFVIGHPIGWMAFPLANMTFPFDWITNRNLAPRIFDNACLALLEVNKPVATVTTYTGQIYGTGAAA